MRCIFTSLRISSFHLSLSSLVRNFTGPCQCQHVWVCFLVWKVESDSGASRGEENINESVFGPSNCDFQILKWFHPEVKRTSIRVSSGLLIVTFKF